MGHVTWILSNQQAAGDVMPSSCLEKMLWNPSMTFNCYTTSIQCRQVLSFPSQIPYLYYASHTHIHTHTHTHTHRCKPDSEAGGGDLSACAEGASPAAKGEHCPPLWHRQMAQCPWMALLLLPCELVSIHQQFTVICQQFTEICEQFTVIYQHFTNSLLRFDNGLQRFANSLPS